MNFKLLKRKAWSDESGVSEIVGNILILMITVVLFSGIMAFVNQMPVPELATKTDFSASVSFEQDGYIANLNITHVGGAVLMATEVTILVSVDDTTSIYKLSEDPDFPYTHWTTGVDWEKTLSETSYYSVITVTIVDDVKHTAIWVSQVTGGSGGSPPIVLQRYVDSNTLTPTPDVIKEGDDFSFYCKITDLDGDLDTSEVWIDSDSLPGTIGGLSSDYPDDISGSWFRWDFTGVLEKGVKVTDLDGKNLIIYAKDVADHTTVSSFRISVTVLPIDPEWYNITTPIEVGEGGLPAYLSWVNDMQGFGIYGERINQTYPNGIANVSDARTNFSKGERIYVRVASLVMNNIFGSNDLKLTDTRTGLDYTSKVVWDKQDVSNAANPFYAYPSGGNVYVYQAVFNTSNLPPSAYTMFIDLASSGSTNYVFQTYQVILITEEGSTIFFIPQIYTFRDADRTTLWGAKTTPFNAMTSDYKVYVSLKVQDAQATPAPSIGEIRVTDMVGGVQLYGPPGSGNMISLVDDGNSTYYEFWVDLRMNNGDNWGPGTNSYTLHISRFSDSNEGVYSISKQIFVRANIGRADFFTGTNGIYSSLGGSTNFINPLYVYYTENNNFFTTRILLTDENAPSTAPLYYHPGMALGDLDGDGDMDLLVGSNMDKTGGSFADLGILYYLENTMNTYGVWQAPSILTRPAAESPFSDKIEWIATGDINNDGDVDFVYSTGNTGPTAKHRVIVYNNTYGAGGTVFLEATAANGGIRKVALEDMNDDGCADLIALVEGRVRVYDLTLWDEGLIASIPGDEEADANIGDFDIADVNGDGMLDIVTVGPLLDTDADYQGVWVNNYTEKIGPETKLIDPSYDGWGAGDCTGWPDIPDMNSVGEGYFSMWENSTGLNPYQVNFTFKMSSPLAADPDPQLVVRAKIPTADPAEVFYVWYSTDAGGNGRYTPVMVIDSSTWVDYRYSLPASIAGAENFYVRITDSSSATVSPLVEYLDVDYLAVESDRFGSYDPDPSTSPPSRFRVVAPGSPEFTVARAANLDGDSTLEFVVARNGYWAAYDNVTQIDGWSETNANLYVTVSPSSTISTSPRMFEVEDINGDGFADIVTTRLTTGDAGEISQIVVWVNIWPDVPWDVPVIDFFAGMLEDTEKGSIVKILVGDVFDRT